MEYDGLDERRPGRQVLLAGRQILLAGRVFLDNDFDD